MRVYERVSALGKREGMQVKWGRKGFSLNAVSNGTPTGVCWSYPPSAYNQSLYTGVISPSKKSNVPQDIVEALRKEAQDTGLFVPVGSGNELSCRTDRRLEESQLAALPGWLNAVVGRIREFETVNTDEG